MKKIIILALIVLALTLFVKVSVFADPSDAGGSVLSVRTVPTELTK